MVRDIQKKRRQPRVVNKEVKSKEKKQGNKSHSNNGFYYSFLTIILLLCLVQIAISAVYNISKIVSYKAKIIQITNTRDKAKETNEILKENINNFSNVAGLEAIARNNLKMSSEDEVLVIINTKPEEEETKNNNSIINLIKQKKND